MRQESYFTTQAAALASAEAGVLHRGFSVVYPDRIWAEHVAYESTVKYHFQLRNQQGGITRRLCHVQLYRMDSGRYELNWYIG